MNILGSRKGYVQAVNGEPACEFCGRHLREGGCLGRHACWEKIQRAKQADAERRATEKKEMIQRQAKWRHEVFQAGKFKGR